MSKQTTIFSLTFFLYALTVQAQQKELETDSLAGVHYLNEVVVTGVLAPRTLKDTPVLTKIISGGEIRLSGATTLIEALEIFVPGVSFTPGQAMGDDVQIQGLENKYVLILVDGERLVGERTEKVNLARLNTGDIKQVEIINGASSTLYGSNAVGSIINIITRDVNKTLQGDINFRCSNYLDIMNASVGFKVKKLSSKTSFSRKDLSTYTVRNTGYVTDPYEDYSLSQSFKYKNDKFTAELKGNYYNQENWLMQKWQKRIDENITVGAKASYTFSEKNILTLSGHSDNYNGKIDSLYNRRIIRANASQYNSFRLTDVWNVTDKIHVVGGTEANFENVFSYNQFDSQNKKYAYNWNLFAQGELKTETGLEALLGARYIRHSKFGGYFAPNISLMYRLDNFRLRGNISNGYKIPTLKELYMEYPHWIGENLPFWIIGNEKLSPEESWYKAVSAEYLDNKINASVTVYDNSIRNKINTIRIFNETENRWEMKYQNVEEAHVTGIETSLQYSFLKYFQLRGGYAFTNAVDKTTGQQLDNNSKHTATANITFKQPHLPFIRSATQWSYYMLLSARVMSSRIVDKQPTGNYYTANFVYTQRFPIYKDLKGEFQFGINNLTDNINKYFAEYNPGRTYFASIGIKF